jgi:hypothetical protein
MHVIVSMHVAGFVWATTPQGNLLTACFFKAEDETAAGLRQMGYQSLRDRYPTAQIVAGQGTEADDLADLFLESCAGTAASTPPPHRASAR